MKPLVPDFATLHSVFSAWDRCGLLNVKAVKHRGNRASLLAFDHNLGAQAVKLSHNIFQGAISAHDIVDLHTHVPLYAAFMTPVQGLVWHDRLTSGAPGRDAVAIGIRRQGEVEAPTLRRCPTCVRDDQARYGCAHWRLFHQWPVARHCAIHREVLHTHCAVCKTPFMRSNAAHLADDPCRTCGHLEGDGHAGVPPPGYWPLLEMFLQAQQGEMPGLSYHLGHPLLLQPPASWDGAQTSPGDERRNRRLLELWGVNSFAQLASLLGAHWVWASDPQRGQAVRVSPLIVQGAIAVASATRRI